MSRPIAPTERAPHPDSGTPEPSALLREVNTEAKCVVHLAVPDHGRFIPVSTVGKVIAQGDGFAQASRKRFNLANMCAVASDDLLLVESDEDGYGGQGLSYVRKPFEETALITTGLAGALLTSIAAGRNTSLRSLIGETRKASKGNPDANEVRHKILTILASQAAEAANGSMQKSAIHEQAQDEFKLRTAGITRHIRKLVRDGILVENVDGHNRVQFNQSLCFGTDGAEGMVLEFLQIMVQYKRDPLSRAQSDTTAGRLLLKDKDRLPGLIARSFAKSTHTGKHTR